MRSLRIVVALAAIAASVPLMAGQAATSCKPNLRNHAIEAHGSTKGHQRVCGMAEVSSTEISKSGGLGSIDVRKDLVAIVERDEGTVALVDIKNPWSPKVVGRYEDDVAGSLDGDVSFSDDGKWVFYARQTSDFDEDGVHVLDVSNPKAPLRTMYQPAGGAYRIEYYRDAAGEWVVLLDAIDGLVVYRFVRESGTLVKVFQDAAPALKVGGPASAGVYIVKKDPISGDPLMYVTTGRTGLQIYDFSDPLSPAIVGEWSDVGLADVKVRVKNGKRLVFAGTEYWFDKTIPPSVLVLDATKLGAIRKVGERKLGVPADDNWRVQGLAMRRRLYVAHSHAGLIEFNRRGRVAGVMALPEPVNEAVAYRSTPYAMDVIVRGGYLLVTDAATGHLWILYREEPRDRPVAH